MKKKLHNLWKHDRQRVLIAVIFSLFIWGFWLVAFAPFLSAQPDNAWLAINPTLGQREGVASGQLPESIAFAGNISCSTTTFTIKPAIPPLQAAEMFSACAVSTPVGMTAPGGFTSAFKSDARLYNAGGGPVSLYPIPGSAGAIVLENTAQGQRLHYYKLGVLLSRKEFNSITREMRVYLSGTPDWTLKDTSGKILHVKPESIAFSGNGKWMVADVAFLATMIVNLETGAVTPFSSPYVYHVGLSVAPNIAVSDDGKTVVTTSDRGDFKVTDISSCRGGPDLIAGPVQCNSVSHEGFLRTQIPGYYRIYQPRFLNDRLLSFYASYNTDPSTRALAKFRLAPSGEALKNQDYLALGDSFASGEGAYDYFPETDTPENMCHLSRQSYPYLIGQQLKLSSYNSVACSGARIQDITTFVQKRNIPSPNAMGSLLPGYKKQLQYMYDENPNVITVGVGGNDSGFISKMRACLGAGSCYQSYEERLELVREINRQFPKINELHDRLKSETKKDTKQYIVGYPRIAKLHGSCAVNVRLDNQEILLANQLIDYLNLVIELSVRKTGLQYANVAEAFAGYKMCETNSQNVAMNGVTAGDDTWGIIGNESFHPNRLGHQLYRQKILEQTSNLTKAMSTADSTVQLPAENSGLEILAAPKTKRAVREITNDESIASAIVVKGQTTPLHVDAGTHMLQPDSTYTIELHSTPTSLGTFTTDSQGNASANLVVPSGVSPGFHMLHVFGTNIVGTAVDIYKAVYVAQSNNDYDGDGVANTIDECMDVSDSAVDRDEDGIDDICDTDVDADNVEETAAANENLTVSDTEGKVLGVSDTQHAPLKTRRNLAGMVVLLVTSILTAQYIYRRNRRK